MRRAWHPSRLPAPRCLRLSVHTLATADTVTPAFKRGATLVEFFEFPATTGDGARKAYAVPAFPIRSPRSNCSISTNCIGSASITCGCRSMSAR